MGGRSVLRDVVHGYVSFDDLDRAVIDTPVVQRLRFIRQNDVAFLVYPSLNTTRFEHSLGVFHVARLIAESALTTCTPELRKRYEDALRDSLPDDGTRAAYGPETFQRAARWYGLLHDVGHLPFSHLAEFCLERLHGELYGSNDFEKLHEAAGAEIVVKDGDLRKALDADRAASWIVRELLTKKKAPPLLRPLKDIVDADVDADRIDATARDGLQAGGDYGNYDIARLARDARLVDDDGTWRVLFTTRSLNAIEGLLGERCKTHRWIHYQQKVVALKNAFRHAFEALNVDPKSWHASRYVSGAGYLDDGRVLQMLGEIDAAKLPPHQAAAREAILLRRPTARALWKRQDEFRALNDRVATGTVLDGARSSGEFVLNRLALDIAMLEARLNDGMDDKVRFLAFKTKLAAFEASKHARNIGTYRIVEYHSGAVRKLTYESKFVEVLEQVMRAESAIGITVVGATNEIDARMKELTDRFADVARKILLELEQ